MKFRHVSAAVFGCAFSVPAVAAGHTALLTEDPAFLKVQEAWGFADAVVAGDTIYLSGVVAGQRQGEDLDAAYARAFDAIGATLKRAGADWSDVVDMTSFHTDLQSQMPAIVKAKSRYLPKPTIAWTAIEIGRLIPDRGITEIKIVARKNAR